MSKAKLVGQIYVYFLIFNYYFSKTPTQAKIDL